MNASLQPQLRLDEAVAGADRRAVQRAVTAIVLATGRGGDPMAIAKAAWPDDTRTRLTIRAAVNPTMVGDVPFAHNIIGLFEALAPTSAAIRLFRECRLVDLTGINTVAIPMLGNNVPHAVFVAEGAPGPVVMGLTGSFTVGPTRKVLVLSAVTRELDAANPQGAVNIVASILGASVAKAIDATAFSTAAATAAAPAGLLHGATPITASTNTNTLGAITEDLGNLLNGMASSDVDPTDAIFVAGPTQALQIGMYAGAAFNHRVLSSIALAGSVAAFAPNGVAAAYADAPQVETSREATLHYEDTNPAPITQAGPAVAHPVYSAFQQELIAVKLRGRAAWAAAFGAAQIVQSVKW